MIRRLAVYKQGAVRLKLSGDYPERFINCCIKEHIYLWNVKKLAGNIYVWIALADFLRLRPAARKSKTRVRVISRYGFPFFFHRLKQRQILLVGVFVFFASLYYLSGYIFFIDIQGAKSADLSEQLTITAKDNGLYIGARRDNISCKKIEKALLNEYPALAWSGVHFTGTRAVIEVVEKVAPSAHEELTGSLFAAKSGIIKECIAIQGEKIVNKGDRVKEGDLLIKAAVGKDGLMQADGLVKAAVEYDSIGEACLVEKIGERTGRFAVSAAVSLYPAADKIVLRKADLSDFAAYEEQSVVKKAALWRNSNLAVELNINIYHELNISFLTRSSDEAKNIAGQQAMCESQKLIPEDAAIIDRLVEIVPSNDDNIVKVKLILITEEEIGKHIKYSQE